MATTGSLLPKQSLIMMLGCGWLVCFAFLLLPVVGQQKDETTTTAPTSTLPTGFPTITSIPTTIPPPPTTSPAPTMTMTTTSISPTVTAFPTATFAPTKEPTTSPPSPFPSLVPTGVPSISPIPTSSPSIAPSQAPTFATIQRATGNYLQAFVLDPPVILNATQEADFENIVKSYTQNITTSKRITTTAEVIRSFSVDNSRRHRRRMLQTTPPVGLFASAIRRMLGFSQDRMLQDLEVVVEYEMTYVSNHSNVSSLPENFRDFVNDNLNVLSQDLRERGINVVQSFRARVVAAATTMPPTTSPTNVPSYTPTIFPTNVPTSTPSFAPTDIPSTLPTIGDTTFQPTFPKLTNPDDDDGGVNTSIVVGVVVGLLALTVGVAAFVYYRKTKLGQKKKHLPIHETGSSSRYSSTSHPSSNPQSSTSFMQRSNTPLSIAAASTQQSTVVASNKMKPRGSSTIMQQLQNIEELRERSPSSGASSSSAGGDAGDNNTNLADEFDVYQDENLNKIRQSVENNIPNSEIMMSQALMKTLMDDEPPNMHGLLWGGQGDAVEIEASALWEVNDWLKRKENATLEERHEFLQETLNKMVASVRHGVIAPEHASRAIHECAAILGLELAEDLSGATLIVTGMPKPVRREHLIKAFGEFGEIQEAAVAANHRGFGLVRYKSPKSINRAMERLRTGEIVVQNVEVTCRVLKSGGPSSSSVTPPLSHLSASFPSKIIIKREHGSDPPTVVNDLDHQPQQELDSSQPPAHPKRPASAPVTRHVSKDISETTSEP